MRVRKADPPSAVGGLEGLVDGERIVQNLHQSLAHEDAAGVGWVAAVEGEQQI
jgi:xanthosine utilization system XapX-like protein